MRWLCYQWHCAALPNIPACNMHHPLQTLGQHADAAAARAAGHHRVARQDDTAVGHPSAAAQDDGHPHLPQEVGEALRAACSFPASVASLAQSWPDILSLLVDHLHSGADSLVSDFLRSQVRGLAMHPTEYAFASAGADNVKKFRLPTGEFLHNMLQNQRAIINCAACNEDGVLATGADNGSLW